MANPQKYKIETWNHLIIFTTFLITSFTCKVFAQSVPNIPVSQFQRREVLDPNVGLALEWSVNRESNTINLQVEIESGNGNFALGLTRKGHIEGSDVIYFEVENGIATPSVSDMFGEDNTTIVQDTNQDWRQISSSTSQNLIRIQIQRNLDTCDEQDLKIDESLIKVVWDYGVNSSLPSQFDVKGVEFVYFTDTRVYSNA
ncbi:DBH-like monooxygenase protein 2, partial [Orchesella cincta]